MDRQPMNYPFSGINPLFRDSPLILFPPFSSRALFDCNALPVVLWPASRGGIDTNDGLANRDLFCLLSQHFARLFVLRPTFNGACLGTVLLSLTSGAYQKCSPWLSLVALRTQPGPLLRFYLLPFRIQAGTRNSLSKIFHHSPLAAKHDVSFPHNDFSIH